MATIARLLLLCLLPLAFLAGCDDEPNNATELSANYIRQCGDHHVLGPR
ncbi:MAG: hypothetical protein QM778_10690 [Myxococcales bacterium]